MLNEDKTFKMNLVNGKWSDTGSYTYDGNNNWYFDYNNSIDLYATGNYEKFAQDTGLNSWGEQTYLTCILIK